MNRGHLPAGQPMQGSPGPAPVVDMGPGGRSRRGGPAPPPHGYLNGHASGYSHPHYPTGFANGNSPGFVSGMPPPLNGHQPAGYANGNPPGYANGNPPAYANGNPPAYANGNPPGYANGHVPGHANGHGRVPFQPHGPGQPQLHGPSYLATQNNHTSGYYAMPPFYQSNTNASQYLPYPYNYNRGPPIQQHSYPMPPPSGAATPPMRAPYQVASATTHVPVSPPALSSTHSVVGQTPMVVPPPQPMPSVVPAEAPPPAEQQPPVEKEQPSVPAKTSVIYKPTFRSSSVAATDASMSVRSASRGFEAKVRSVVSMVWIILVYNP